MKKILTLIFLLYASVTFADEIKISYFVTYPHITFDQATGKLGGPLYEMIQNHIAPAMGDTFVWAKSPSTVPRLLDSLEKNQTDVVALMVYTADRAKAFCLSEKPFYKGCSGVAVLSNNPLTKVTSADDLLNLKIGYAKDTFVSAFMQDERLKFDNVNDPNFLEINMKRLIEGSIQASYLPDNAGLLYFVKKLKADDKVKVLRLPENPAPFHVFFTKTSADKRDRFNKAYNKVNGSELYLQLLAKYLDVSKL